MPEVPLPLLLLRRQPIRSLAQKDRHVPQIHAKALSQPLALATSSSLAVEPGAGRAAETALAIPFPRQAAGEAVAEGSSKQEAETAAAIALLEQTQ